MAFERLLDPVLNPLLNLGYFWALFILSFMIALIIVLIYKYTTNQSLMKDLKGQLKEFQREIKELKSEPQKAMQVQKKMMETNMKYMTHSFKPMLFTFLPIIIIFGWMNVHLAYAPIDPGAEFSVTMTFQEGIQGNVFLDLPEGVTSVNGLNQSIKAGKADWSLKADSSGEYLLTYEFNNRQYSNEILVTNEKVYKQPVTSIKKEGIKKITVNLEKIKPLNLGFYKFGWLWAYIIFSIIFSTLLRKLFKVY